MEDQQSQLLPANEGQHPQIAEIVAVVSRANESATALQSIVADAQTKQQSFSEALNAANAQLASLEGLVSSAAQRDAEANRIVEECRSKIASLESAVASAQQQIEGTANASARRINDKIAELEATASAASTASQQSVEQSVEKLKAKVAELEASATASQQAAQQSTSELTQRANETLSQLDANLQQARQRQADTEGAKNGAQEQLANARQALVEIETAKNEAIANREVTSEARAAKEKFDQDSAAALGNVSSALAAAEAERTNFVETWSAAREDIQRLTKEAEAMLFGATNAGLASTFTDVAKTLGGRLFWSSAFFVGGIVALVGCLFVLYEFMMQIVAGHDFTPMDLAVGLFLRAAILVPLGWFCYFFSRRAHALFELQQHYIHKASLAASVEPFRRQAGEHASTAVAGVLQEIMKNPADVLRRHKKMSDGPDQSIDDLAQRVGQILSSGGHH